jgi:hypothetical protein
MAKTAEAMIGGIWYRGGYTINDCGIVTFMGYPIPEDIEETEEEPIGEEN